MPENFDTNCYTPLAADKAVVGNRRLQTIFYIRRAMTDGLSWIPPLPGSERVAWATMLDPSSESPLNDTLDNRTAIEPLKPACTERAIARFVAALADRDPDCPADDSDIDAKPVKPATDERFDAERRRREGVERELKQLKAKLQEQTEALDKQSEALESLQSRSFLQRVFNQ